MQAIIPAAGFGRRLKPITDNIPKCLVPVKGKPLLVRSLELLSARGIRSVVLIVGHMKDRVYRVIGHRFGEMQISYVENDIYDRTNNVYSLWLARDRLDDESLLLECDLYYDGMLLDALLEKRRHCNVLVSKYDPATMDGTVVEIGQDEVVKSLTIKKRQGEGFVSSGKYKTVNMYYWSKDFLRNYFVPYLDLYVRVHGTQSYYEQVLGALIYLGEPQCHAVIVDAAQWQEIDNPDDLRLAEERLFSQGRASRMEESL